MEKQGRPTCDVLHSLVDNGKERPGRSDFMAHIPAKDVLCWDSIHPSEVYPKEKNINPRITLQGLLQMVFCILVRKTCQYEAVAAGHERQHGPLKCPVG